MSIFLANVKEHAPRDGRGVVLPQLVRRLSEFLGLDLVDIESFLLSSLLCFFHLASI
jgi:hypothetical protein